MKRPWKIVIISLCIVLIGAVVVYASTNHEKEFSAGENLKNAMEGSSDGAQGGREIAAIYNGQEILMSAVQYQRSMNIMRDGETAQSFESDFDIVNRIVESMILVEEAERQGLAATEDEIEEMVDMARRSYEIPEGREMLDAYCEGAGISIEEYYELIREQAPRTIARQKLKDAFGKEYCEKHGLEFTKENPPEEMVKAENAYISELFEKHKDEIQYFIDTDRK